MSGLTQQLGYQSNVKAGVCDVAEAPVGTAYDDATGLWLPVGIVEPGSFKTDFGRKFFDFMAGIPETIHQSFVVGISGKFSFGLTEITANTLRIAAGGVEPFRTYGSPSTTVSGTPAQATSAGVTRFDVTSASGFAIGMFIEVETNTPNDSGKEYVYITDIQTNTLYVQPRLIGTATATTGTVKAIATERTPVGTSTIRQKSYRMVFQAVDNSQVVVHLLKGRANGLKPEFPQGKNMVVPVEIDAYGIEDATLTPPQPVVAQLYYLPPGNTI